MSRLLISLVFLWAQLHTELQVQGDPNPEPDASPGPIRSKGFFSKPLNQELLTRYLLSRLLGQKDKVFPQSPAGDRREDQATQASDIFPLRSAKDPLQKLLDHAKANIDVIDFRNPDEQVQRTLQISSITSFNFSILKRTIYAFHVSPKVSHHQILKPVLTMMKLLKEAFLRILFQYSYHFLAPRQVALRDKVR